MRQKFNRACSILLLVAFTITGIPSSVLAENNNMHTPEIQEENADSEVKEKETTEEEETTDEEEVESNLDDEKKPKIANFADEAGVVNVSTWAEFLAAYNDEAVKKIKLTADITAIGSLTGRTTSIEIDGSNDGENFLLNLVGRNLPLKTGEEAPSTLKLENIRIASTYNAFVYGNAANWVIHAKNVSSVSVSTAEYHIDRLVNNNLGTLILEGNIDLTTSHEAAIIGNVEILEGTNFKLYQAANNDSAFWFSGTQDRGARYFRVGDNSTLNMSRKLNSGFPPVFDNWTEMTIGNNVNWYQDNYQKFVADQVINGGIQDRNVIFGKRNKIEAVNSASQSIHFAYAGKNYIEFGPGSSMKIQGAGNIIDISASTSVKFRNPVGLDLESTGGRVFNLATNGNVEFQYVTMSTWNFGSDTTGPADAEFAKVTSALLEGGGTKAIANVTSENEDLVTHFKANNSKRIVTEKIPIGKVAVGYVNQFGETVGEPQIIDIVDKEACVVDEEIAIPDALREKPAIPEDYHYATEEELKEMGKTQPKYAYTGMEAVNDPRITAIYVHSDKADYTVNFVNVSTNKTLKTSTFNDYIDETIKSNDNKFIEQIPSDFHYAEEDELKEGQEQKAEIKVVKNGEYTIYIAEAKELADAKETAKEAIEEAAEDKIEAINNVPGATDEEKKVALDELDKVKNDALAAIDSSKTVEDIETAKNTGLENIGKVELPKSEVEKAKETAKAELEQAAEEKIAEINNVPGATQAEKDAAIGKVNEEKTTALGNIDNSTTVEEIGIAKDTGVKAIEDVELPKSDVEKAKDNAKAELEQAAEEKIAEINNVPGATQDEKDAAIGKVNEEKTTALGNIDNSKTVEEVTGAKDTGVKAIGDVELPKSDVEKAKDTAKVELEQAAEEKIAEINKVPGATQAEKDAAIGKVNEEKTTALGNIENSKTVDEVTTAKNTGLENIKNVELPKSEVEKAKDAAKEAINKAAEDKIAEINNVPGATQDEKDAAIGKVNEEKTTALGNIENSKTVDEVTTAKNTGLENIKNVELPKSDVEKAKDTAKVELEQAAEEKIAEINNVPGATQAEKDAAIGKVNEEKTTALGNIDNSKTVDEVTTAKNTGIENIGKVALPKSEVEKAKDAAKEAINKAAEDKIAEINNVPGATQDEKDAAIGKVNEEKTTALGNIDNSTTVEEVTGAKDTGVKAIEDVELPKSDVEKAKDSAKAELEQAAEEKIAEINKVPGATQDEKDAAIGKVNEEKTTALGNIENSKTVDEVTTAKNTGVKAIEDVALPKSEVEKAKDNAKAEINKAAEDKIDAIKDVPGATEDEITAAIGKVNEEKTTALGNIDNSTTVEEVTGAKDTGVKAIEDVELPKSDVEKAKDSAKAELEQAAEEKIAEINKVSGATQEEKDAAIAEVNTAETDALAAIDSSKTVEDIGTAKDTGLENIKNVELPKVPEEPVDKDELSNKLEEAKAIETDGYTEESVENLEEAIKNAESVLDNPDATEEDVNNAIEELGKAIEGLEEVEIPEVIDKTELVKKIEEAERKLEGEDNYTSESIEDLRGALDRALEVNEREDATEEDVINAYNELSDAINNLIKIPEEVIYKVNYDGNGARGTAPYDSNEYHEGDNVIVLGRNSLEKSDYTFKGWSTSRYATRGEYQPGDSFTIRENTTLYAIWEEDSSGGSFGFTGSWTSSKPSIEKPVEIKPISIKEAYIKGYEDGTFRPKENMTRGEVAAIFTRLKTNGEESNVTSNSVYNDVNSTDWYAKYVGYVTENNLMKGYEDGTFRPEEKITRAEFVTAIARYNSLTSADNSFTDANGHWAEGYIGAVTTKSWIKGYPDGTFKPDNNISREEVVVIINRMEGINVESNSNVMNPFKDVDESLWSYKDIIAATSSNN